MTVAHARFYCGLDPMTNNMMEIAIKLECREYLTQHQECCVQHGFCYLRRMKREQCDQDYCRCLAPISTKEGQCKFHAGNFCNHVKGNGHIFYPTFTVQNGRR